MEVDKSSVYPNLRWIRQKLRHNPIAPFRRRVLAAYIVGSEARGTARPDSDIDIAVIVEPLKRKTSLKLTEEYYKKFKSDRYRERWNGRLIDFQLFFPGEIEQLNYNKFPL